MWGLVKPLLNLESRYAENSAPRAQLGSLLSFLALFEPPWLLRVSSGLLVPYRELFLLKPLLARAPLGHFVGCRLSVSLLSWYPMYGV